MVSGDCEDRFADTGSFPAWKSDPKGEDIANRGYAHVNPTTTRTRYLCRAR